MATVAGLSSAHSRAFAHRCGAVISGEDRIALPAAVLRKAGARGLAFGTLLDRVHPVWVESQVAPDGRHRVVGSLVGPDGVDGAFPA